MLWIAEGIACVGRRGKDEAHNVPGQGLFHFRAFVGMETEKSGHPGLRPLGGVQHDLPLFEGSRIDPGVKETVRIRVGENFENKGGKRLFRKGFPYKLGFPIQSGSSRRRDIQGRREKVHNGIQNRLNPNFFVGGAAENRNPKAF